MVAVNQIPTGNVTIVGTAAILGEILTADASTLSDADGLGPLSYRWVRNGVAIDGAINPTYQLDLADSGASITVIVQYRDGGGTDESVESAPIGVNDFNSNPLPIVETPTQDPTLLTASAIETIQLIEPNIDHNASSIAYDPILGLYYGSQIGSSTYTADVWDGNGAIQQSLDPLNIDARSWFYNENTGNIELVTFSSGLFSVNRDISGQLLGTYEELNASLSGSPTGQAVPSYNPLTNELYAYGSGGNIVSVIDHDTGALKSTIELDFQSAGISGLNSYFIGFDPVENALIGVSDSTAYVFGLDGSFRGSSTLTVAADGDFDAGYANGQLFLFDSQIQGWQGYDLFVTVAQLPPGFQIAALSRTADTVTFGLFADPNQDPGSDGIASFDFYLNYDPTILSIAAAGVVYAPNLIGEPSLLAEGLLSVTGFADSQLLSFASFSTPIVEIQATLLDPNQPVDLSVTGALFDGSIVGDSFGTFDFSFTNSPPTGAVTITGLAVEDQTLTANTDGLADADGLGPFSYQWLRDGVAIAGATAAGYTLGQDDVGSGIAVAVSYTDGQGTAEAVESAASAPVELGTTVYRDISFSLRDYNETSVNLILTGTANVNGTGNSLENTITGNSGNNILNGSSGNDILIGNDGDDIFRDDSGDDIMQGGTGADRFEIGAGNDFIDLGVDSDADVISLTSNQNQILQQGRIQIFVSNFISGQDTIDFSNLDIDNTLEGRQGLSVTYDSTNLHGSLYWTESASNTTLYADINNDNEPDILIHFIGTQIFNESDLII
ncbi:MAG: hypothetical protein KDC18_08550 [Alphaproteobacteria bacterium]|nr:hypothetical protein [Alphaproteobacteria bacterium]